MFLKNKDKANKNLEKTFSLALSGKNILKFCPEIRIVRKRAGNREEKRCQFWVFDCLTYTVKKRLAIFPSPAEMSQTKLCLVRNNLIITGQEEFG